MGLVIPILVIWITIVGKLLAKQWKGKIGDNLTIYNSNLINNKNNIHGSLPKGTKSKTLTISQLVFQLQTSRFQSHSESRLWFHTIFQSLVPLNKLLFLACAKMSPLSKLMIPPKILPCHFNLNSTNTLLS